jgi:recombination protein RecA
MILVIFINQIRMKIGTVYGNPETTTGGHALKFYTSVRLEIRRVSSIKSGQDILGNRTRVKVVKNKLAPPFKEAEFDLMYGEGISQTGEVLDVGVSEGVIDKSGSWYSYNGERIGQGRENVKKYFDENPDIYRDITEKVQQKMGLTVSKDNATEDQKTPAAASGTEEKPKSGKKQTQS